MQSYRKLFVLSLLSGALLLLIGCQPLSPAPGLTRSVRPATPAAGSAAGQASQLVVDPDPDGASVTLDGKPAGASPITLTLPAGVYQLGLSAPGFAPLTQAVTLTAGQEGIYSPVLADVAPPTVTISAEAASVPWSGTARVRAKAGDNRGVSDLKLDLNGQMLGEIAGDEIALEFTPAEIAGLKPDGTYTLTARAADEAGNTATAQMALAIGPSGAPAAATGAVRPAATATRAASPAAPSATALPPTPVSAPTAAPAPAEPTTYRVDSVIIPTYPYSNYLHTAADAGLGGYPVLTFNRAAYEAAKPQPMPVRYTEVILENRFVKLTVLPELGGRIYECIFKPTGSDEFYKNPVIKPTQWGPGGKDRPAGANWWLAAGGLEWAFPVEEHGYDWGKTWGYDFVQGDDGSATVTVFGQDYQRPFVSVSITLPPDSAAFTVQPRITNPLGTPFRFKWWDNAMLAPGPANKPGADLRFIIPGSQITVHSTNDTSLPAAGQAMAWPVYGGRDLSRLGNWRGWLGFFARPAAQAGFAAVYDTAADEGMVRVFPPDVVRGVKGYGMGWSAALDPGSWTDDGSGYVELHGGLAPTFDDWSQLPAGGAVGWTETWYPAAGTGGLVYAAAGGAINVSRTAAGVQVAVFPARPVHGRLQVSLPGAAAVAVPVDLSPEHPFRQQLTGAVGQGEATVTLLGDAGQTLLSYRGVLK